MTDLVAPETIGGIVGAPRDETLHIGRAVSDDATVYVLHSAQCLEMYDDARDCPFSRALDVGVDGGAWEHFTDMPVVLKINGLYGDLEPVAVVTA